MKTEFKKIDSYEKLKNILRGDECHELFIQTGTGRSWKTMSLDDEGETKKDDLFYVLNQIDETEQTLTGEELFDSEKTNIGKALEKGELYYDCE